MAPKVKNAKNSKLPKLPENCFETIGKGGWPSISTWITQSLFDISINIPQMEFQIDLEAKSENCMKNNIKLVNFLQSIESLYVFIIIIFFYEIKLSNLSFKNDEES